MKKILVSLVALAIVASTIYVIRSNQVSTQKVDPEIAEQFEKNKEKPTKEKGAPMMTIKITVTPDPKFKP